MPDPTARFETVGLDVRVTTVGDAVVVTAVGEIDVATSPLVADVFDAAVLAGCRRMVLDARRVTFMGACGLRPLIEVERTVGRGSVAVCNPSPPVLRLLQLVDRCDLLEHGGRFPRLLQAVEPRADVPLAPIGE
jgi:anti-anti-sigma factor